MHTVRSGKWKLHIRSPELYQIPNDSTWIDPSSPDGVTILAPFEQAKTNQHPGITSGDKFKDVLLFDLETDPTEQKNLAELFPDVVKQLKSIAFNANFD